MKRTNAIKIALCMFLCATVLFSGMVIVSAKETFGFTAVKNDNTVVVTVTVPNTPWDALNLKIDYDASVLSQTSFTSTGADNTDCYLIADWNTAPGTGHIGCIFPATPTSNVVTYTTTFTVLDADAVSTDLSLTINEFSCSPDDIECESSYSVTVVLKENVSTTTTTTTTTRPTTTTTTTTTTTRPTTTTTTTTTTARPTTTTTTAATTTTTTATTTTAVPSTTIAATTTTQAGADATTTVADVTTAATTAADQTGAQTGDNLRNLYAVLALLCLAGAAVSTVMLVYRKKVN